MLKRYADAKTDDEKKRLKKRIKRGDAVIDSISKEIAQAGRTASQLIQGELTGVYGLNYEYTTWDIQNQLGYSFDFAIYDRNQIAVILSDAQRPFTKIAFQNLGDNELITTRLQDQLLQGIALGESQSKLIKRIRGVVDSEGFNARRIIQTERNRTASQGRQMGFNEAMNMGIEMDKQWIARMRNTRDSHQHLNMQIVKADAKFKSLLGDIEYPGDPSAIAKNTINCFCIVVPKVGTQSKALLKHRQKFNKSWDEYSKSRSKT